MDNNSRQKWTEYFPPGPKGPFGESRRGWQPVAVACYDAARQIQCNARGESLGLRMGWASSGKVLIRTPGVGLMKTEEENIKLMSFYLNTSWECPGTGVTHRLTHCRSACFASHGPNIHTRSILIGVPEIPVLIVGSFTVAVTGYWSSSHGW